MAKLHAIKLVMDNGIIEDFKQGIVIVKEKDSMSLETCNVLPVEQIALTAIALNELMSEYLSDEDSDEPMDLFKSMLKVLIANLLNTNPTKGEVVQ